MTPDVGIGLVTGAILFATAVVGLIARLTRKVDEVHVLVNDRMTEALTRIEQLSDALAGAGVEIPDSPRRSG